MNVSEAQAHWWNNTLTFSCTFMIALALCPHARAEDGVCAQVTLQLQQRLVITRTAFRATLELDNGLDAEFLEDVTVTLDIRDEFGEPANHKFNTSQLDLTGIDRIDPPGGSLPPVSVCTVSWTIVPRLAAAPTEATQYDVGAELRYIQGDELYVIPMYPERITVLPDPLLQVKYFWQRDVFSDDPFTPEFEPSVPFNLGLMIHNAGAGTAHNMRITSGQPTIIENEDELLINFQLIGTQVNDEEVSPSLTVDFGDVGPGETAVARFLMTASLQGHFVCYGADYEHVTGLGDPQLSLIEDPIKIYELTNVVRVDRPTDDGKPDFLVNLHTWQEDVTPENPLCDVVWEDPIDPHEDDPDDIDKLDLPDTLFASDNTTAFVTPVLDATVTPDSTGGAEADVEASMPGGWAYIKVPDPFEGQHQLVRVEREDGSALYDVETFPHNAWQTDRVFKDSGGGVESFISGIYRVHLFDHTDANPSGEYRLVFVEDNEPPCIAQWQTIAAHGDPGSEPPELPLKIGVEGFSVEPRASGIQKLVVLFDEPIRGETFNLLTIHGLAGPDGEEIEIDPASLIESMVVSDGRTRGEITFSQPLQDFARYCFRLEGVQDTVGNPLAGESEIVLTALVGDVTGDRRVNNTDVGAVISLAGTDPIDWGRARHLRADVNHDGRIDEEDVNAVLVARGKNAQQIPPPCPRGRDKRAIPEPTLFGPGE